MKIERLLLTLLTAALLVALTSCGGGARGPGEFITHNAEVAPGELTVRFREGVAEGERTAVLAALGASIDRELLIGDYFQVSVRAGREEEIGRALARSGVAQSVEQEPIWRPYTHLDPLVPNDAQFGEQWNMQLIRVEEAWDISRGAGVVVAVVDTGVAFENNDIYGQAPDLAGTGFVPGRDFFGQDDHANDDNGHGTHIAGTIAETTNNGIGVVGVAPGASIMPIKVCGADPAHSNLTICKPSAIADGVVWAVNNGADVINISLGGTDISQPELDALQYAREAGVVVIAAAGNGGADGVGDGFLEFPAAVPSVISVGATGITGLRSGYSNYGAGLDLVAPGGAIRLGPGGQPVENSYIIQDTYPEFCLKTPPTSFTAFAACGARGTSMAAAHVSGAAALLLSYYEARGHRLTANQVRDALDCSAKDVGLPGYDLQHGHGLLQAYGLLQDSDGDGAVDCLDIDPPPPPNTCPGPSPTPSPAPTATATSAPTEVATPTDTPTPTPTETPMLTETPTPVPTETASPAAADTASPSPAPADTGTPAPTEGLAPAGTGLPDATPFVAACGDVDCDGDLDAVDALFVLRFVARLGEAVCIGNGYAHCDATISSVDALTILRKVARLPLFQPPGCPPPGYG